MDLFAGPGGWDHAARGLGLHVAGLELDADACATRAAAGLPTIRTDVAAYPPRGDVEGLIASPPCQAFSRAGLRAGRNDGAELRAHVLACVRDWKPPAKTWADPRSPLVLEPLRWAHALHPRWIVLEQVPPVLPLWQTYCVALETIGYRAWCGTLDAADYGTPQNRERAILIARLDGWPAAPIRTHGRSLPWVTMADALGWFGRVGFPRRDDTGRSSDGYRARDWRTTDRPSQTVTDKARSWRWQDHRNDQSGPCPNPAWPTERPATTIAGRGLVPDPGANANRFNGSTKSRNDGYRVDVHEAGILQGFPSDYPWRGSRTRQFQQVGDAVPPPLAAAILSTVGRD